MSRKPSKINHINYVGGQPLSGALSVDIELQSAKGVVRKVMIEFDQYDMIELARKFHTQLNAAERNLIATRKALAGES